ncbi:hypothetical protein RI578_06705 [Streptomyces sp. BB1-1-1]|uniref:hypothetical protein n=1 Tax=Streptomyces sp. BB1-1-1 TaxID=3074430 RepID=UPI002877B6A7|nr:hypothetical protein [Streptomyces sp. BB1-1-1]WND34003.1 hypothetical protein RI578_06705 [Streptomyces sp. BB1-1-1]
MIPVCHRCHRVRCICQSRAVTAVIAVLAAVALLAGCGGLAGPQGTVTGKEHDDARTTWRTEPKTRQDCTLKTRRIGKSTTTYRDCRTVPDGTRRVHEVHPECWELELDTGDEVCVSEDVWNATAIGDEYGTR